MTSLFRKSQSKVTLMAESVRKSLALASSLGVCCKSVSKSFTKERKKKTPNDASTKSMTVWHKKSQGLWPLPFCQEMYQIIYSLSFCAGNNSLLRDKTLYYITPFFYPWRTPLLTLPLTLSPCCKSNFVSIILWPFNPFPWNVFNNHKNEPLSGKKQVTMIENHSFLTSNLNSSDCQFLFSYIFLKTQLLEIHYKSLP